ncbi:lysylphosphatidylglycerol synthase transmembrane domain-containing protein [Noviherbaspirillum soli]|uniref:lysylphosphatidylglycerol synthase transmembrane domain-containing protein n=1 Tax=Noviherbaspirillum soli TaxID=1064518 RepID=UPI00188A426F|nr:lysylphosphatidylglycerol synthase transmembrane domain-containing protein [Noviherbaspirillum soli]
MKDSDTNAVPSKPSRPIGHDPANAGRNAARDSDGFQAAGRTAQWFSWILGLATLVAAIVLALHFSEEREFVRMAERAQPWWLLVAFVLQGGTYIAQGSIWRMVLHAAGHMVPSLVAFKLSIAKLFIDQALPSAGLSGTVVVARAFALRGISRATVMASVVIDGVSYYGAYVLTLAVALGIAIVGENVNPLILVPAVCLVLFAVVLVSAALVFAGRKGGAPHFLMRIPLLERAIALLGEADPALARSASLIIKGVLYHLLITMLDVSTVWVLICSFGEIPSFTSVFMSFIAATLLRTISIVPGGLGVYEATSVLTLQHAGISLPVALAATLLFRGLSFWLPMLPGLFFSRAITSAK